VAKAAVIDLGDGKFVIRKFLVTATKEGTPNSGGGGKGGQFKNWSANRLCAEYNWDNTH
jgi:hypothetical protein